MIAEGDESELSIRSVPEDPINNKRDKLVKSLSFDEEGKLNYNAQNVLPDKRSHQEMNRLHFKLTFEEV